MKRRTRIKWDIAYYPKFTRSYLDLDSWQRWMIKENINNLRFHVSVNSFVRSAECPHLDVPNNADYHVLDLARDGYGDYTVKLLVYEDHDENCLWPIYCIDYSKTPNT